MTAILTAHRFCRRRGVPAFVVTVFRPLSNMNVENSPCWLHGLLFYLLAEEVGVLDVQVIAYLLDRAQRDLAVLVGSHFLDGGIRQLAKTRSFTHTQFLFLQYFVEVEFQFHTQNYT